MPTPDFNIDPNEGLTPADKQAIFLKQNFPGSGPEIIDQLREAEKIFNEQGGDPLDILDQIQRGAPVPLREPSDLVGAAAGAAGSFATEVGSQVVDPLIIIKQIAENAPQVLKRSAELAKIQLTQDPSMAQNLGGQTVVLGNSFLQAVKEAFPEDIPLSSLLSRAGGQAIGEALGRSLSFIPGAKTALGVAGSVAGGQFNQALGNEPDTPVFQKSFPFISPEVREEGGQTLAGVAAGGLLKKGVGKLAKTVDETSLVRVLRAPGASVENLISPASKSEKAFFREVLPKGEDIFNATGILDEATTVGEIAPKIGVVIQTARDQKSVLVTNVTNSLKGQTILDRTYARRVLDKLDQQIKKLELNNLDKDAIKAVIATRNDFAQAFGVDQPNIPGKILGPGGKIKSTPVPFIGRDFPQAQEYLNNLYESEKRHGLYNERVIGGEITPSQAAGVAEVRKALNIMTEETRNYISVKSREIAKSIPNVGNTNVISSLISLDGANSTIHHLIPFENAYGLQSQDWLQQAAELIRGATSEGISANLGPGVRANGLAALVPKFIKDFIADGQRKILISSEQDFLVAQKMASKIRAGENIPRTTTGALKNIFLGKPGRFLQPATPLFAPALGAKAGVESLTAGYPAETRGFGSFNPANGTISSPEDQALYSGSLNGAFLRGDMSLSEFRLRARALNLRGTLLKFDEVSSLLTKGGPERIIDSTVEKKIKVVDRGGKENTVVIPKTEEDVSNTEEGGILLKRASRLSNKL